MTTVIVYSWSRGEPHKPDVVPALFAWANELLVVASATLVPAPLPDVRIRRDAVFAWPYKQPPGRRAADTVGRVCHALVVSAKEAAAARVDMADELFAAGSWRNLAVWLSERGYDRGFLEEEITPVVDPHAPMFVNQADDIVNAIDAELLRHMLTYFQIPIRNYLRTWARLADADLIAPGEWEVVVPADAVESSTPC